MILFVNLSLANIVITEIMPNPIADERLNEWIEIYNNSTEKIDITNLVIEKENYSIQIKGPYYKGNGTILEPYNYAIITDYTTRVYNNFNVSNKASKLYAYPSLKSLKNSGSTITIRLHNQTSTVTYNKTKEAKSVSLINHSWAYTEPTPGYSNEKRHGCDWQVEIISNKSFYNKTEFKIKISKIYGEKANITLSRKITDSQQEIKKEYKEIKIKNILNKKTIKIKPAINLEGIYNISVNISTACDINPENNFDSKLFFVKNKKIYKKESKLTIKEIYDLRKDNKTSWGDLIRIGLKIYKGDTDKKTIKVFLEKNNQTITKQTKINLENKFSEIETVIPIQIPPNCKNNFKNDKYNLIIKGLDSEAQTKITIDGLNKELCKPQETKNHTITIKRDYNKNKLIMKSKNTKIKENILIIFSITLLIVITTTISKPL
jgi:hypothetical protein